ncbi:aminotransferase class IV [Marinospirillum perlucidum]|uniref:aminotransferase class IV n=1 Tax=Marinospirillum perlucidum TaxID=1982602 RepID=UPI000DF41CFB|nr:aminotransferase class IV [Marinospirillum perlucidum]
MSVLRTLVDGHEPSPEDLDWLLASRALAFGEGVFTSVRIWQGRAIFWPDHLQRLKKGLQSLKAEVQGHFWEKLQTEVQQEAEYQVSGMLKVMLLAGPGGRGYRRGGERLPWHRVLSGRQLPLQQAAYQGVTVWWQPSPETGPQTDNKHLNRLCQVLASEACPDHYPEALLHDSRGRITEAIARNVFWYAQGTWHTPALSRGALEGVMRKQLLQATGAMEEDAASLEALQASEEVLLCNSLQGIWPVVQLDAEEGSLGRWPLGPQTRSLMTAFHPGMGLPQA